MKEDTTMTAGGEDAAEAVRPWADPRRWFVIFVRCLALLFIASGLWRWSIILGPSAPGQDFLALPMSVRVATVFFAVADLVAAVGLWLLAAWGAVVWLIVALTQAVLYVLFPAGFGFDPRIVGFHVATVVVYAVLTWLVDRRAQAK